MDNTDQDKTSETPETNPNDLDMESQEDSAAVTQDQHGEGQAGPIDSTEQVRHQPENTQQEENLSEEGTVPNDTCITSPCQLPDYNIQDLPNSAEQQTTKLHCYSSNGHRVYQPSHDDDDDDDEDLHNLWETINILSVEPDPPLLCSGSSLNIADYQGLQQAIGPASQSWLSERGNPVCHPCSDTNRNSNHTKNASQQGEDPMEILAHQELLISNSTTADDVGEDEYVIFNNNLKIPRYVCKLMAENPTKAFRVTPCPKTVKNEIADPTNYLLDSGYNGTSGYNRTLSSAQSQQLESPHPTTLAGAVGFQQPMEIQAETSIAKLQSLGGASSDPNYDVNIRHDSILPTSNYSANFTDDSSLCDVLFVHEGYAMFTLRVPRGIHVNTLITMNQFTQQVDFKSYITVNTLHLVKFWSQSLIANSE